MSISEYPPLVSVIGPEGSGKTTVCADVVARIGGTALIVPAWPAFQDFLADPAAHAYDNQQQAMESYVAARDQALAERERPIVADMSADRIHSVFSTYLRQQGLLDDSAWSSLATKYQEALRNESNDFVYTRVGVSTLLERVRKRKARPDDAYNLQQVQATRHLWEELVASPQWQRDKNILVVNTEEPRDVVADKVCSWLADAS